MISRENDGNNLYPGGFLVGDCTMDEKGACQFKAVDLFKH